MRETLKGLLNDRLKREIAPQSPLKVLRSLDFEMCVNIAISVVYLYTRTKRGSNKTVYATEVFSAIGHNIINKAKLKRDSSLAAKIGAFFCYSFEQLELLEIILGQGNKSHAAYIVQVTNEDGIVELWESIPSSEIEKLPSETPYAAWSSVRHENGSQMIKTGSREVLSIVQPDTHPILFSCLNKAQQVGWQINEEIYDLQSWALRNQTSAFRDIWEQRNPEAKTTKLREARAIGSMAARFVGKTFYHLYYYDFRGRRYPTTAYLHEQGTDLARGLLLRADRKAIGESGLRWLFISLASSWAGDSGRDDGLKTDKLPLKAREEWARDNGEILLSYATSPKVNQGWMEAEKPWQFLAACIELRKAMECDNPEDYVSGLECFIDGSNNGSQHLVALVRDEVIAPHVNLVPLPLPGDLYKYVSKHVWEELQSMLDEYSHKQIKLCNILIDNLIELKKILDGTEPRSDKRREVLEELRELREDNQELLSQCAPVFWMRVTSEKHRRKVVKRNVMTLPYGGTPYGLGQQQIDDAKKHGIDLLLYMENRWGSFMGRLVYDNCKKSVAKLMQLLSVFEQAGKDAEVDGRFLSWTVPITNFPVVQNYTQGKVKKIWVQYGPPLGNRLSTGYYQNTFQLQIAFLEDVEPSKGKQSLGASPNGIHSFDAGHLCLTVHRADFPVTTIHDSYGCLLADMPKLFKLVRETFVEFYKADPLASIMKDIGGNTSEIIYGNLDINLILESEYCFV